MPPPAFVITPTFTAAAAAIAPSSATPTPGLTRINKLNPIYQFYCITVTAIQWVQGRHEPSGAFCTTSAYLLLLADVMGVKF